MILLQTTKSFLKEILIILVLGNIAYCFSPKIVKTLIKTTTSLMCNLVLMLTKHSSTLVKSVSKGTSSKVKSDKNEEMDKVVKAPKKSKKVTAKDPVGKTTKVTSKKKQPKGNVIPFPDAK